MKAAAAKSPAKVRASRTPRKPVTTYREAARVHAYARDVVAGRIVAGRFVVAACRRHLEDLDRGAARNLVWRPDRAESALHFFERVLHLKDGVPFTLEPFQAFIVGSLFGWYRHDPDNPGTIIRRFRYCYAEIGKANGKTPLAAGICLYGLVVDDEHAPEIYSAAAAKEQARICFQDAQQMVYASPELRGRVQVLTGSLSVPSRYAVFRPLSSEDKGQHGKRVHICVLDEIHAHNSGAIAEAMVAGTKNCRNALIVVITNSGRRTRQSICWEYHETARRILEGVIEKDDWFCYVCTLDSCPSCHAAGYRGPNEKCRACDSWQNPATWLKANPGLGTICRTGYVRERVDLGQKMPSALNNVLQLNFCVWTESDSGWANMSAWNHQCHRPGLRIEDYAGRPASIAMDAANKVDVTSLVAVFEATPGSGRLDPAQLDRAAQAALAEAIDPAALTGATTLNDVMRDIAAAGYVCFHRSFVPRDMVDNARQANYDLYQKWARADRLIITDGGRTDFSRIMAELATWRALFPVRRFGFDPREMSYFVQQLQAQPWCDFPLVEVTQSPQQISQPMKELEALINAGLIGHAGDEVLTWMLGNVVQKTAAGGGTRKYYFPGRENDENKIDGAVALIMALDGALRTAEPQGEPGVVFL